MLKIEGLNQHAFAMRAGIGWHQVTRLVSRGAIKPVAEAAGQLIFNPDDAEAAAAAIKQSRSDDETKFRPAWDALTSRERASYGTLGAFIAFEKNKGSVTLYANGRGGRALGKGVR